MNKQKENGKKFGACLIPISGSNLFLIYVQSDEAWRKTVVSAEVDQVDLDAGDFITAFEYLMEKEALVLGTSNGLMLLHSMDTHVTEVVGRVEGGIKCISPSPDGDLLGITTGFGQLLVMTHDWDLLHETAAVDLPEGADVSKDLSLSLVGVSFL